MRERTKRNIARLHGVDAKQLQSVECLDDVILRRHGVSREDAYPAIEIRGKRSSGGLDGEELRLAILALISSEPRHGYDLIGSIASLSGGAYKPSPGSVYPKLQMLVEEQAVTVLDDGRARRKTYTAGEVGTEELKEKDAEVRALFAKLEVLAADSNTVFDRQIDSALEEFGQAVALRRRNGAQSEDVMKRIHELILDAVHQIERL